MDNLPKFVCVGASKCGTTSLYEYLRQHPDIFLPAQKELHYFSYAGLERRPNGPGMRHTLRSLIKTEKHYRAQFASAPPNAVSGDISPSYLTSHESIPKMRALLGAPKIIILLRDPVQKIFAQYMHMRRSARESLTFENALKEEENRNADQWGDMWLYKRSGYYADHVEAYLNEFGRDNVRIYLSSDLQHDPLRVLVSIFDLLEVSTDYTIKVDNEFNKSGLPKSELLARTLNASMAANFAKRILPRRIGSVLKNKLQSVNTGEKLVLSDETEQMLRAAFKQDTLRLEELIGRETGWLLEND